MKNVAALVLLIGLLTAGWLRRDEVNDWWAQHGAGLLKLSPKAESGAGQVSATPHPAGESRARAVALYPALGMPNSSLNQKFVGLYKETQLRNPAVLSQPDWPLQLAERAVAALSSGASPTNSAAASRARKEVVIYTTWDCPYCQQAKQYFAKKGIRYREMDIERSSVAKEEYRKLGGNGVPLILVGEQKVKGFSATTLDRLLF